MSISKIKVGSTTHTISATNMLVPRAEINIATSLAANQASNTEAVYFAGSNGVSLGFPTAYCIANIKRGTGQRTLIDCYHLETGDHYINSNLLATDNPNGWTGWIKQPSATDLNSLKSSIPTKISALTNDSGYITGTTASNTYETQLNAANKLAEAKTYTDNKISELIGGAPEALNALNELAEALGNNPNFATAITTELGKKANVSDLETLFASAQLITVDDIDSICGASIAIASDEGVVF